MDFINTPHSKSDDPLYSSRLIKNYVIYVKKYHPEVDIESFLNYAGITTHEVEDQGHWLNQRQVDRFHEILTQKTGDPNISRKVGRFSASAQASGSLRQYVLGFVSPSFAYKALDKFASNLSRAIMLKTVRVTKDKVDVMVTPRPGAELKPYQCDNLMGMLEAIARLFTNKFAKIEHPACIHRGDNACRYIITWDKSPSLIWKRVRNYALLISILVTLVLLFVLSTKSWLFLILISALFTTVVSIYSTHFERKELIKTIKTQGDTAEGLLEEMNIRYNNALLVQEIGQATSTILEIDKLVDTVVSAIRKRLDFDRGMIMLANQGKTRLVYAAGYGYSKEQEGLLRGVEFHLDNPESKGMFVIALKEQKPFLVNDIAANSNKLSKRSLELAKQMGVQSIICVPIVYEKNSFGILAVDNIKSGRLLTQSDMNLLMGVSAQLAVNIVEAISFEKLQESEKKYRDLVENANSIILRFDTDGYITFFNEFAQKLFSYSEDEILEKNIRGTFLPDTESTTTDLRELIESLRQNPERPAVTEGQYVLRKGGTAWIAWTSKPIFDSDGQLKEILTIGSDLTALKRAGQEKESLEAQLLEAQKMEAIGTLAGGIAHDFNNILQGIIGYAQILLMGKETGDPDQKNLQAIERLVRTATELTKRLLIFSRKVESKLRPVDLNQEVEQVTKMLKRTIPRMIDIELHLAEGLKIINADPLQTEQIIMNLGVNARDAMPEGGKLIFKTENTTLDGGYSKGLLRAEPGQYVLLSVSDTGDGMGEETLEHIFEPFFTTKEPGKGTGLGLSVVYGIVKSHNGYIACDSRPGRGTIFRIYFPIIKKEPERLSVREVEAPIKVGSETILLVDDEENIREPWKKILVEFGYTVFTTTDGESALEFYRKEHKRVDLTILDLIMPGMGGKRCLVKLLQINPQAKVIIASGYAIDASTRDAIEAGAKVFVSKPFEIRSMLKTVREVLDQG